MLSGTVINRYARGLLAYAQAHDVVDALDAEFADIAKAIEASEEFQNFLANPVLPQEMKLSIINKLLPAGVRKDLSNFIALLLERGRGGYIAVVAERFHALVDDLHGRIAVDIESAQPLTQAQTENIVAALKRAVGKEIQPNISQNPQLIAGYRVKLGNRVLDATTQSALRQFRDSLLTRSVRKEGTR